MQEKPNSAFTLMHSGIYCSATTHACNVSLQKWISPSETNQSKGGNSLQKYLYFVFVTKGEHRLAGYIGHHKSTVASSIKSDLHPPKTNLRWKKCLQSDAVHCKSAGCFKNKTSLWNIGIYTTWCVGKICVKFYKSFVHFLHKLCRWFNTTAGTHSQIKRALSYPIWEATTT